MTTQERFFEIDVQVNASVFFSKVWKCPHQSTMAYYICHTLNRQRHPHVLAYVSWNNGWLQIFYDKDVT